MCDASAGFALTDDLFIAADDESNELRTYSRSRPGHPVSKLDLRSFLLIGHGDPETDIEGSAHVGDTVYWITSHARNKDGKPRPARQRFFATQISKTGQPSLQLAGKLYAGLLREGLGPDAHPERLAEVKRIEREIEYLKTVVTEFLEYARRSPPQPERFGARALLEEVAEICAARVKVDAPGDLLAFADRAQLRRALLNLARNAVAAAGPQGEVVLAARASGERIEWEVRDSGAGVPDELREKIFAPFFTTREKGTGLGLAFVREIVRDHGAEIALDRAPEGGARFRFSSSAAPAVG